MIVLTVLSYNGAPADGPSAQFDELGGTIGRADNNQLVLPDPERTISRVHARVVFRAGTYAIVDNGSNPISVNGTPVGAGREHPLRPGDQLQIGGYVLKARAAAVGAAVADPFADLFGDAAMGLATSPPGAKPERPTPAPAPSWPPPPPPPPALVAGHIPEDWDPFAPDHVTTPPPRPAAAAADAIFDLPRGGGDSIDDLFDLSGSRSAADPLGAPPAQAHRAAPNMAAHDDPLQSLASAGAADLPSRSDHFSDLNTPMPLPTPMPPPAPAAPAAAPLPAGAVFSWNDPPRDGRVVTTPGVRRQGAEPPPTMPPAAAVVSPVAAPVPAPARAASRAPVPASASADQGELLAALLAGLGTPDMRLGALTPETMHLIGQLLREAIRGTVELLVARTALKREMRAEMTMIVARENNPLKFSPTVEVALQHLLGPQAPGFMASAPAVRDAYDDLRAHQLGVMAGMRAALDGVLQRFDPQQLEGKLTHRSAISTLIPATRKAKLWESFQELFAQLQVEAQDDFDELFGRAFLRAYEDQLDRMSGEPGPR
jgi:type VI secretion system FHA domain protein